MLTSWIKGRTSWYIKDVSTDGSVWMLGEGLGLSYGVRIQTISPNLDINGFRDRKLVI
jgi:hypothetical protein